MPHLPCKRPDFGIFRNSEALPYLQGKTAFPEEEIVLWKYVSKAFYAKRKNVYSKLLGREECTAVEAEYLSVKAAGAFREYHNGVSPFNQVPYVLCIAKVAV